jgi:hypothetical protein
VIAESLAVGIVTVAVLSPASYLLHVAWKRGGVPRTVAIATLIVMFVLVAWLFMPGPPGTTVEDRVSQFVGAWGILFMVVGLVVIAAAAFGKFRPPEHSDREK